MRADLDAMDHAAYDAPEPAAMVRVLGAFGPRMLALASERADGAHPYLVPTKHTHRARQVLGRDMLLCPEVAVVLEAGPDKARGIARSHLGAYLGLANYRRNLSRLGYDDDLADRGSDRLVDAVIGWGHIEQVARRMHEHLEAGADHVAI